MIVIDTSIAFKWFNTVEPGFEKAISLLEQHLQQKETILVPDLLIYELTNAWTTKTSLTYKEVSKNLLLLERVKLKIQPVSFNLCRKASQLAKKYHLSVYDAIYAVIAKENKCYLYTADAKFKSKTNLAFIRVIQ